MPIKQRVGTVVSNKMQKTVVVAVENRKSHPKYGKIMARTKRYKAHDEENHCQEGDLVRITETRPLSRTKRWTVAAILSGKAELQEGKADSLATQADSSEPAASSESIATNSSETSVSSETVTHSPEADASLDEEIPS